MQITSMNGTMFLGCSNRSTATRALSWLECGSRWQRMPKQYQFADRADFGMQRAAVPRLSQGSPQNFTHGPATPIKPRLTFTGAQSSAKLRTLRFAGSQNVPPNIHRTFAPSFGGWRQRVSRVTPFNSELTCSLPLLALAFTPAGVFSGRRTLPASRPARLRHTGNPVER